ncbi:MAG: hypothetical protein ACW968_05565 [Candidatus Thorarchaeota archaeon]
MDFDLIRDFWVFAQIGALILTILVVFAPAVQTTEDLVLIQSMAITLIGIYGGVKGLGKKKTDPANTFGTWSGAIRFIFAIIFVILLALVSLGYIAGVSDVSELFVVTVTVEAWALALPAIAKNFK